MAQDTKNHQALGDVAARQLANTTKTAAADGEHHAALAGAACSSGRRSRRALPRQPREGRLAASRSTAAARATSATLPADLRRLRGAAARVHAQLGHDDARRAHARLRPLQQPIDQIKRAAPAHDRDVKERQESELINNGDYGLLQQRRAGRCASRPATGAPTPDDLDELIARVWKEPAFFLAHPRAIAAFGRECTRRGVPPPTVTLFGSPFLTWRGLPLVPCDKLPRRRRQEGTARRTSC